MFSTGFKDGYMVKQPENSAELPLTDRCAAAPTVNRDA